jgi:hypothetical protein
MLDRLKSYLRTWLTVTPIVLLALVGRPGAAAVVDAQVLVVSSGKGADQIAITYAGPVAETQAREDLQSLSDALSRPAADVRITTKRIAARAPQMTSIEAGFPGIVDRAAGKLLVQPFVETFRRYPRIRLTYFIEGTFKLVSPATSMATNDFRLTVDNQGALVNYDVWIRPSDRAARIPALDGPGPWARLLVPGLIAALVAVIAVGVAVSLRLRRSRAGRLEGAEGDGQAQPAEPGLSGQQD